MHQPIRPVIIGINQVNIRQWFKAPLDAAVHIKISDLCIVLKECRPE